MYPTKAAFIAAIKIGRISVESQNDVSNASFAQGKSFVVVEDDAMVSEALRVALSMMGGTVMCFDNGEDALQYPNIENADCYIVDYRLSGKVNGINFLSLLHQKMRKSVCAVMISGDTSPNLLRKTEFFDWPMLHKPINLTTLLSKLREQYKRGR
jgi:DNA-binding NtrC family response regulator